MPPDSFDEFWNDLEELVKRDPEVKPLKGFNKTYVEGSDFKGLLVAGKKGGRTNLVPRTLFMVLWNALTHHDKLTREELEEEHNLTRVLFLMSLANKLDYINYNAEGDSINLVK